MSEATITMPIKEYEDLKKFKDGVINKKHFLISGFSVSPTYITLANDNETIIELVNQLGEHYKISNSLQEEIYQLKYPNRK